MVQCEALLQDSDEFTSFKEFANQIANNDATWSLWYGFVFNNCYCYLTLYLSIRSSNWKLRLSSLKQMAPLSAAFDHGTYKRIIPQHLADIQHHPDRILQCLQAGGFTVRITGKTFHSVAFDEAHEMCINKDMKTAVTHASEANLQKKSLFLIVVSRHLKT